MVFDENISSANGDSDISKGINCNDIAGCEHRAINSVENVEGIIFETVLSQNSYS